MSCRSFFKVSELTLVCRAYIEELERRVKSLEQQLQQQGRLGHEAQQNADAQELASINTAATVTDGNSNDATGNTCGGLGQIPEKGGSSSPDGDGSDQVSSVVESNDGKIRFFGWLLQDLRNSDEADTV